MGGSHCLHLWPCPHLQGERLKGAGSLWRDKLAKKYSSPHGVELMVRVHPQAPSDMSGAPSEKASIGFQDFNY